MNDLFALSQGLMLGASLIIAIGAQNVFVLTQGIRKNYIWVVVLICALSDSALIILGVNGLSKLISGNTVLINTVTFAGALFLGWYGFQSFRSAMQSKELKADTSNLSQISLKATIVTTLALTYLNPHVYLDTVILLGSIGSGYPGDEQVFFTIGACLASFMWFSSLGFGARWMAPILLKPKVWKGVESAIGVVMWSLAGGLLYRFSLAL